MPDSQNDSRRAYANAPVNSRTAPKPAPPPPASVRARTQKARQRQLLGAPLSELAVRRAPDPADPRGLHPAAIATAVCAIAALSALLLLRSGTGLALAAALSALGGACWLWQRRSTLAARQALNLHMLPPATSPSPFDEQALHRIDQAFEAAAAAVSEPALEQLMSLKAAAARMALALDHSEVNADFTVEHRLYVIECIRRYIPDTLSAYLQVPPAQRALPGPQAAKSADQILRDQLALLQSELEQRERLWQGGAVEPLLRQQRFLESKATQMGRVS